MKKRIKKIIIIILLLIIIVFIINVIRNSIIINKIISKQIQLKDCKNYSFTRIDYSTKEYGKEIKLNVKFKDNVGVMELPDNNYVWCNTESQAIIHYNTAEKIAYYSVGEIVGVKIPFNMENISIQEKILMIICSFITSKDIDGQNCYCVQEISQVRIYYNKDTGIPVKKIGGGTIEKNGHIYESVIDIKNWSEGKVTDEDVKVPDLSEYEIRDN